MTAARPVPTLARAWGFTDRSTGRGWLAFDTVRGTVYHPRTPALASALSALGMGELVVDDKAARSILDKFEETAAWVRAAEDARRSNPAQAESSGLTASIEGYWAAYDRERGAMEGLRTKANRAILTQTWQSAADKDLETLGAFHAMARELAGQAKAVSPARPGAKPPPVAPAAGGGLTTVEKVGIGLAALSALFGGVALIRQLTRP